MASVWPSAESYPSGRLSRLEVSIRKPGALLDAAAKLHLSAAVPPLPGGATVQKGKPWPEEK